MSFDKIALGNFRTAFDYMVCLSDYYLLPLLSIEVMHSERNDGLRLSNSSGEKVFDSRPMMEAVLSTPTPNNYIVMADAALADLSRQVDRLFGAGMLKLDAGKIIEAYRAIYYAIESLADLEKSAIKINLIRHEQKKMTKRFLSNVNVGETIRAAKVKLKKDLTAEEFDEFEKMFQHFSYACFK